MSECSGSASYPPQGNYTLDELISIEMLVGSINSIVAQLFNLMLLMNKVCQVELSSA